MSKFHEKREKNNSKIILNSIPEDDIQHNKISLFNQENMKTSIQNLRESIHKKNKFLKNYNETIFRNENENRNKLLSDEFDMFDQKENSNENSAERIYDNSFISINSYGNKNSQRFLTSIENTPQNAEISVIGRKFGQQKKNFFFRENKFK